MKTEGSAPVYEQVRALQFSRISTEDADTAVVPITNAENRELKEARDHRYVRAWREANPFYCTRWMTAHGVVTGIFGWKFYRGECIGCGTLLTAHAPYPQKRNLETGKWPQTCGECREARERSEPLRARQRMARLRRKRYAERDAGYVAVGMVPPRQGVPPKGASSAVVPAGTRIL